jgi:hypothetical protein
VSFIALTTGGVIEFEVGEKNFISTDVKITSEGAIMI